MPWTKTPADRRRDSQVYGPAWRKLRQQALDRDGHRCVMDGSTRQLTVDHIAPLSQGGTHNLSNLRTLCLPCHRKVTAQQGRGYRNPTSAQQPADPQAKPSTTW